MKIKFILFLLLFLLIFSPNASATCDSIYTYVTLRVEPKTPTYITNLSRKEFSERSPHPVSPNTLGLTVVHMKSEAKGVPSVNQKGRRACVGIKEMTVTIKYDRLDVYIDKKYKPGSCAYKVIKSHENYHVAVSQQGVNFFKRDIEKALKQAAGKLKPEYASSEAEAQRIFERQFNQILKDIQPHVDHMNKKIAEKNAQIDTPESYDQEMRKCKDW